MSKQRLNPKHKQIIITSLVTTVLLLVISLVLSLNHNLLPSRRNIPREEIEQAFQKLMTRYNEEIFLGDLQILNLLEKELNIYADSELFREGLKRKSHYQELILDTFKKNGVNEDFIFIPFVESHYNPEAANRNSGARGMWQFIPETARSFGLRVTEEIDERTDPDKSTAAAAHYLKYLQNMFGENSFFLIAAAYNAGEGRIQRTIIKIKDEGTPKISFWELYNQGLIPGQTRAFVIRIVTYLLLAENPHWYEDSPRSAG